MSSFPLLVPDVLVPTRTGAHPRTHAQILLLARLNQMTLVL